MKDKERTEWKEREAHILSELRDLAATLDYERDSNHENTQEALYASDYQSVVYFAEKNVALDRLDSLISLLSISEQKPETEKPELKVVPLNSEKENVNE
mgnify:CR=1 FL=1